MTRRNPAAADQTARIRSASDHCLHCYDHALHTYRQLIDEAVGTLDAQKGKHYKKLQGSLTLIDRYMPAVWRAARYWDAVQGRPNVRR